jgi:c-di-GMP-binding flagellar brake protein YcgR
MAGQLKLDDLQSYDGLFATAGTPRVEREQRRHARKPWATDGMLMAAGVCRSVRTIDLSAGGVSITSGTQLAVGTTCGLSLTLDVPGGAHTLQVSALVTYCFHTAEHTYQAGLAFMDLAPADHARIAAFTAT